MTGESFFKQWQKLLNKMIEMDFLQNMTLILTMKLMESEENQIPFMMMELEKKPTEKHFQTIVQHKIDELNLDKLFEE